MICIVSRRGVRFREAYQVDAGKKGNSMKQKEQD